MKKEEVLSKVIELLESGQMVRVYLNDHSRAPIYGKFVKHSDHKDIFSKGLVRFVTDGQMQLWDEYGYVVYTKLLTMSNFLSFKTF